MKLRLVCVLVVCVLALSVATSGAAVAGEQSGVLRRISCPVVRYYVAKYSAPAAEHRARAKGASDTEIAAARRCLASDTTRTAKAPQRPLALGETGRVLQRAAPVARPIVDPPDCRINFSTCRTSVDVGAWTSVRRSRD
jgi:hypothetical protein